MAITRAVSEGIFNSKCI